MPNPKSFSTTDLETARYYTEVLTTYYDGKVAERLDAYCRKFAQNNTADTKQGLNPYKGDAANLITDKSEVKKLTKSFEELWELSGAMLADIKDPEKQFVEYHALLRVRDMCASMLNGGKMKDEDENDYSTRANIELNPLWAIGNTLDSNNMDKFNFRKSQGKEVENLEDLKIALEDPDREVLGPKELNLLMGSEEYPLGRAWARSIEGAGLVYEAMEHYDSMSAEEQEELRGRIRNICGDVKQHLETVLNRQDLFEAGYNKMGQPSNRKPLNIYGGRGYKTTFVPAIQSLDDAMKYRVPFSHLDVYIELANLQRATDLRLESLNKAENVAKFNKVIDGYQEKVNRIDACNKALIRELRHNYTEDGPDAAKAQMEKLYKAYENLSTAYKDFYQAAKNAVDAEKVEQLAFDAIVPEAGLTDIKSWHELKYIKAKTNYELEKDVDYFKDQMLDKMPDAKPLNENQIGESAADRAMLAKMEKLCSVYNQLKTEGTTLLRNSAEYRAFKDSLKAIDDFRKANPNMKLPLSNDQKTALEDKFNRCCNTAVAYYNKRGNRQVKRNFGNVRINGCVSVLQTLNLQSANDLLGRIREKEQQDGNYRILVTKNANGEWIEGREHISVDDLLKEENKYAHTKFANITDRTRTGVGKSNQPAVQNIMNEDRDLRISINNNIINQPKVKVQQKEQLMKAEDAKQPQKKTDVKNNKPQKKTKVVKKTEDVKQPQKKNITNEQPKVKEPQKKQPKQLNEFQQKLAMYQNNRVMGSNMPQKKGTKH